MSKTRTKKLRYAFEMRTGFTIMDRDSAMYKKAWRKFKNNWKRGRI